MDPSRHSIRLQVSQSKKAIGLLDQSELLATVKCSCNKMQQLAGEHKLDRLFDVKYELNTSNYVFPNEIIASVERNLH